MAAGFDVRKVAMLASLGLTPEEEQRLAAEFAAILAFVEQVQALPLEGLPPSVHAVAPPMPLEDDEPQPCLDHERALAQAPDHDQAHFKVPPILPSGRGPAE